jgi:single-strand DNA-binding protein
MGKSLNKATIIGHAGKDAEVRYTGTGKAVASFSVATTDSWKDKTSGQMQEKTEWHNIVAWERLGEICGEYVKKGKRVYIEGRIQTRSYDDKEGVKRYSTEIVASDMILLDGGGSREGGGREGGGRESTGGAQHESNYSSNRGSSQAAAAPAVHEFDQASAVDDLPF